MELNHCDSEETVKLKVKVELNYRVITTSKSCPDESESSAELL